MEPPFQDVLRARPLQLTENQDAQGWFYDVLLVIVLEAPEDIRELARGGLRPGEVIRGTPPLA